MTVIVIGLRMVTVVEIVTGILFDAVVYAEELSIPVIVRVLVDS